MNSFSYSINIKHFQNLLDSSADKTEPQSIQKPRTEEKAQAELQETESKAE